MCQHDTTSFIQYRLQQITYEYMDCKWLRAQNGPTNSPSIYLGDGKESIESFVFLHQGIYDFGGAGGEGRYEKGTEILKTNNVNVHLKTVPL